ncbi:DMT family transporter [Allofrancisella guangzhouensis]|uniref:DMT family transporter n=1 Tax=Allofrancisella guangzhouensis TaxID=594679 RepID=UPI0014700C0B|nr:DMT family transporter [Allofrancisella guangzhouensis]MBK2027201.1 DMT family transporter [Allofrancisella guangzhouensis]MBK2044637.1 DMT family transporter [Allofrancisella guangzhouensis]MBK2045080.1 DMT family transporter [Allofrancisella guangzhouensis]
MKSLKLFGIFVGVLSGVLWGLNDVYINIFSIKMEILSTGLLTIVFSLLLAFVQDTSSSLSIFGYHYFSSPQTFFTRVKSLKKIFWLLCLAAIFAGPLGMVAGIVGISYAGPIYAGVVTSCYPIVALVLAIFFLKEKPTNLKILGIVLSVLAVIFISIAGEHHGGNETVIGIMFAFCAMLGWGLESILFSLALKKATEDHSSFLLATRQFCSAMSYLFCLTFFYVFFPLELLKVLERFFMIKILIICVVSAMTSYIAYYYAIKRIGASLGTTFNATFIFWAGFFSIVFHLEKVTLNFIIWGGVLVIGIYFATKETIKNLKLVH